ncbi:hypothetical protein QBC34DRAFT_100869 [Podospora aff. communis PSN243]|uniref:SnoaL-like domain-containing protein n=1 Tax=Podospora aff. communis PSN243 TaxID=3040156 RepID=A0AAV9GK67_9PEZI|nr:hypothetical protein QBC34DRAFT_100869 [Podospora aff. communis PSN243]
MQPPSPDPYSSQEAWTSTLLHAFNGPDSDVESTFLKLYTRDTAITIDGKLYTFESFLEHVMQLRSIAVDFVLDSHCFLRDGNKFAEKHTLTATLRGDGNKAQVEGYVFGELGENGKAVWVDEATRTVQG